MYICNQCTASASPRINVQLLRLLARPRQLYPCAPRVSRSSSLGTISFCLVLKSRYSSYEVWFPIIVAWIVKPFSWGMALVGWDYKRPFAKFSISKRHPEGEREKQLVHKTNLSEQGPRLKTMEDDFKICLWKRAWLYLAFQFCYCKIYRILSEIESAGYQISSLLQTPQDSSNTLC